MSQPKNNPSSEDDSAKSAAKSAKPKSAKPKSAKPVARIALNKHDLGSWEAYSCTGISSARHNNAGGGHWQYLEGMTPDMAPKAPVCIGVLKKLTFAQDKVAEVDRKLGKIQAEREAELATRKRLKQPLERPVSAATLAKYGGNPEKKVNAVCIGYSHFTVGRAPHPNSDVVVVTSTPVCSAGVQLFINRDVKKVSEGASPKKKASVAGAAGTVAEKGAEAGATATSTSAATTDSLGDKTVLQAKDAMEAANVPLDKMKSAALKHTTYVKRVVSATTETIQDDFLSRWKRSMSNVWARKSKTAEEIKTTAKKLMDMGK